MKLENADTNGRIILKNRGLFDTWGRFLIYAPVTFTKYLCNMRSVHLNQYVKVFFREKHHENS
jgi:hypothetical protein